MAPSIGVNLRVTGHWNQGGRNHMEDTNCVYYQMTEDEKNLKYAYFGIFDGHGGKEAALFAREHLVDAITKNRNFWSEQDEVVLQAIKEGFHQVQQGMWKDLPNWRPTSSGLPSTAGTTASICFIMRGKLFVGHCGDSGIILGEEAFGNPNRWNAHRLTIDHKPDSEEELERIERAGGKVVEKSGVPRVVWYRPRGAHQGPVRRSTHIDEVPFLAVARSLGDLWSYNAKADEFIVSPEPDLHVYTLDPRRHRCLILATDGAWNVLNPDDAVQSVFDTEKNNERFWVDEVGTSWVNPSKRLVETALHRWKMCNLRADNTSVVTVMLDPPGPPRTHVIRKMHNLPPTIKTPPPPVPALPPKVKKEDAVPAPEEDSTSPSAANKGFAIISRFPNSKITDQKQGKNLVGAENGRFKNNVRIVPDSPASASPRPKPQFRPFHPADAVSSSGLAEQPPCLPISSRGAPPPPPKEEPSSTSSEIAALERLVCAKTRPLPPTPTAATVSVRASETRPRPEVSRPHQKAPATSIQCNKVSSSDVETSPASSPPPLLPKRRKASGPPVTRSRQIEAAPPPEKHPRLASASSSTSDATTANPSSEYNSDSENHLPQRVTTRSSRRSAVQLNQANNDRGASSQQVKPLSLKNSRRSEPILRQAASAQSKQQQQQQANPTSPRKQASQPSHANPVLTRVLRSRNSLSALSLSPASVMARGRQQRQAAAAAAANLPPQRGQSAAAACEGEAVAATLAVKRKRRSAAAPGSVASAVKASLNPKSPAVAAAAAAGHSAKRARVMRNK